VVEVLPQDETHPEILARITPTERTATVATEHGFRFSEAFMDVVSELLVEMVREEDEKK
jgi:hypothetical protein